MNFFIMVSLFLSAALGVFRGIDLALLTDAETGLCIVGPVWLRYGALAVAVGAAVAAGRCSQPKPKDIKAEVQPNEILLVVDSMTGQDAVNVAKSFNDMLDITGVILTKLDGDTRGGAALSVLSVTGKPIKFAGVGEKTDDLEQFHPNRMADRILGMGDVLSLIEKAKINVDEKEQEKLAKRLQENKFDMNDLYAQFEQIEKMGSISSLIKMIPGVAGKVKEEDIDERRMYRTKAIISSMTKKEREKPSIIDAKRKRRIAAGSGTKVEDVNQLLKQFDGMQKMMKQMGLKGGKKRKFPKFPMGGMGGMNGMGGFPM